MTLTMVIMTVMLVNLTNFRSWRSVDMPECEFRMPFCKECVWTRAPWDSCGCVCPYY